MLAITSSQLVVAVSAELYLMITRSREITVLVKQRSQRTTKEQIEVNRGLLRAVMLEALVFVPASAALVLMAIIPFCGDWIAKAGQGHQMGCYALLGVVSYGFPFAVTRRIIVGVAARTLTEFASIAHKDLSGEAEKSQ